MRNSKASRVVAMPPMPITGISTLSATWWTSRTAKGRIAGPERPAVTLEIMGRRRCTSTLIPTKVLTRLMASAPASWQARAKMRMSVTLGESFTQTGLDETRVTASTT